MHDRAPGSDPPAAELPLADLAEGRRRFLALVASIRPDLHRYCARMTGSVADGEDVVQETLARAYYVLSEMEEMPPLRPWLFRIAHRRAIDHLRRVERTASEPLDAVLESAREPALDPEDALAHEEAVHAALSRFVALAPTQRSCVILKDVLGHSLEEIAELVELTVPAVKAALHRGRTGLRAHADDAVAARAESGTPAEVVNVPSPLVARYAALFNARDWDGVRAMLADEVRLDLVSRAQRTGRRDVGSYFTRYDAVHDWHLVPARLEGREVLAVFPSADAARPTYFVELTTRDERITLIRDFRYVPYAIHDAAMQLAAR